jgi:hypothetical protein
MENVKVKEVGYAENQNKQRSSQTFSGNRNGETAQIQCLPKSHFDEKINKKETTAAKAQAGS